jgi:superfamily II DNA/RNA helicase
LKHGFNAGALHGDMDQKSRMETLDKFRNGDISLLAASDVAARGLDIPDVSHVFNFDLPWQSDDYVHRIGRTGRAGKEGTAQSIVTPDELKSFKDIEKIIGEAPVWIGEPPTEDDFADAGKRRRGRGRGGHPGAQRESGRSDRGRSSAGEGGRSERGRSEARPEDARRASGGRDRGPRRAAPAAPGLGEQPSIEPSAKPARPQRSEGAKTQAQARPQARPERAERPKAEPRRDDRPAPQIPRARAEPAKADANAFAGNVPAFLRRPPRPVKAASE